MGQTRSREHLGRTSYLAGASAEGIALRAYSEFGYACVAQRWRGQAGEIDLVLRGDDVFVFVEVKKSRSFEVAATHVSSRQKSRLLAAAEEFVASQPDGLLSQMRFDVVLVDAHGRLEIIENALWDG